MDATSNTTSATNNPVAATTSPQFLQQNQNQTPQQPIPNDQPQSQPNAKPMMISSFQPVDPNVAQQPAPSIQQRLQQVEEPPQQNLVPSNNTPVAPTFHATNQQQQSTDDNMEQSDDDSQTPTPTIQLAPTQPFPFPNPFENMVPTLNPMQPPPMNFPPTPMQQAAMNLVRVQNPLQLLQQDTENMPQPPPFVPPPFFAPPQQLPVPPMQPDMNLPTNEQNNLPFNPQQNIFNPPNNMQEDHQAPSFPGPPPVPPQFMQQPQDFNPRGFPQRPEFRPPPPGMNPESFPPIRPDGPGNGMNFRPPQNFDNMPENDFAPPQQFNQNQNRPPFNDNRPPFRP
ncbi:uncharacterized protein, partial [Clytia hemisphaerica]|uniref:uncharacterized protein n=1 Tax=Clytia hemisphaerica TaxID=252671 RepID=UPI0034D75F42